MEEKILAKSEQYNVNRGLKIFCLVGIFSAFAIYVANLMEGLSKWEKDYWYRRNFSSPFDYAWFRSDGEVLTILCVVLTVSLFLYVWLRSHTVTVTDKRVYGQTTFGKRVDLPIDSVSAIGSSWPKGVAVATSSGRIAFLMIKNCDEIHKCVSNLLIERQNKPVSSSAPVVKQEMPMSNADELKKYKELLDMGVITQEEFDTKKKQLLGL